MGNVTRGIINWQIAERLSDQRLEVRWKCFRCNLKDYCSGGCYDSNMMASKSPYFPPECLCAEVQAVREILMENPEFVS
ncbi:MAG: hypothetical protein C4555_01855 [Dehalococcoidia bacterium]|nr:MAG: hypothetical protein C4555_01855 [Dehalococcoidia bacterium]